jgi:hypothetical protein
MKGRQKKYEKACVLLEQTLKIRVQILGMEHEAVAQALYSLGIIFSKRNEIDAALKALTDCLSIRQLKLCFDAVEIADTLHGCNWSMLGKFWRLSKCPEPVERRL